MHYILESFIVGIFSAFIYLVFNLFISNVFWLPFLIGFCKHLFGYLFLLQEYYCNYGCQNNTHYKKVKNNTLIIECILEGIIFLVLSNLFLINNQTIKYFSIGVFLHISSEYIGIHKYYCENRCV
jgi:hypothetical protein